MTSGIPATIDRSACAAMDAADPLAEFRDRFVVDDATIYLDGNSLGRLPKATLERVTQVVRDEWGTGLVRSWTDSAWMDMPQRIGARIARLIGVEEDEVLITDTTSVDLFKLVTAVLTARPERGVVLSEQGNFPSDIYVAAGSTALLGDGRELRLVDRDAILESLDDRTALLMLTHVDYRTGYRHDMEALTAAAHDAGALVLWDLCHSVGAVPLHLGDAGVDLAAGCSYKYLNGGPGSPAFLHVARRLQDQLHNPIQGWLGHASPFTLETEFRPASGIRSWMSGSPPVIAIAALEAGVELHLEAGAERVGAKAAALTELFIRLADLRLAAHDLVLATPRDAEQRGAQVALRHPHGYPIIRALIDRGVIGDFRDPDVCRFGLAPLYTRYVDVWDAVERIVEVMQDRTYLGTEYAVRGYIT